MDMLVSGAVMLAVTAVAQGVCNRTPRVEDRVSLVTMVANAPNNARRIVHVGHVLRTQVIVQMDATKVLRELYVLMLTIWKIVRTPTEVSFVNV